MKKERAAYEDQLEAKRDVEIQMKELREQYEELERGKSGADGGEFVARTGRDEEYERLRDKYAEVDRYMLSLYDFERFNCSYLADAARFLKTKPALPLKPAKAPAAPDKKADLKKPVDAAKAPAAAAKKPAGGKAPAAGAKASAKKGKK